MMAYVTAAILGVVAVTMVTAAPQPQMCLPGEYKIIPKQDCSGFYLCVFGRPVEMPDCPQGSVFSTNAHVCVPVGSVYDDCKPEYTMPLLPDAGPLTVEEECRLYGGIIPHPTECQLYYNCSVTYDNVPLLFEQHMMECPYPQLFDVDKKQCDHFENVKCAKRIENKDACKYISHKCPTAHCIPCYVSYSNCESLSNGMHPHAYKLWSPYYVVCYKERMISAKTCPADEHGRTQLFHPDMNECVSLDKIPQEHGGLMAQCGGRPDGFYLDDFGRCDRYHYCQAGQFVNTVNCKLGETFDSVYGDCVPSEKACGPCGKRDDC